MPEEAYVIFHYADVYDDMPPPAIAQSALSGAVDFQPQIYKVFAHCPDTCAATPLRRHACCHASCHWLEPQPWQMPLPPC